jgi:hypothetical protein
MDTIHYIGFDVHKKSVSYCVKRADGSVVEDGRLEAERGLLRHWAEARSTPWRGTLEATLFSGWIYDTLKPYAQQLEMAHPAMLKAIGAAKKKSDRIDARKIAGLLMEVGAPYNRNQLHGRKYFQHLVEHLEEVPESVKELPRLRRGALELFQSVQKQLVRKLHSQTSLCERVQRLRTIP